MNPQLSLCISNLAKGEIIYNQLGNDPGIDVLNMVFTKLWYMFQRLGALVNGDIVEGESPDDLDKNIRTYRRNMDFLEVIVTQ